MSPARATSKIPSSISTSATRSAEPPKSQTSAFRAPPAASTRATPS
jgi:hypothetical protein